MVNKFFSVKKFQLNYFIDQSLIKNTNPEPSSPICLDLTNDTGIENSIISIN